MTLLVEMVEVNCLLGHSTSIFHTFQNDVMIKLNLLWKFVKPISFALIGKEVDFAKLDLKVVGFGIAIVLIASAVS